MGSMMSGQVMAALGLLGTPHTLQSLHRGQSDLGCTGRTMSVLKLTARTPLNTLCKPRIRCHQIGLQDT